MNLYKLNQDDSYGYDTYDNCVVAAESEEAARNILPTSYIEWGSDQWARYPSLVSVRLLGVAVEGTEAGVICASFNAG